MGGVGVRLAKNSTAFGEKFLLVAAQTLLNSNVSFMFISSTRTKLQFLSVIAFCPC